MNFLSNLSASSIKAIAGGIVGGLGSSMILGVNGEYPIPFLNFNIDSRLAYGLVTAGAIFVNDSTRYTILPMIIQDQSGKLAHYVVSPALTGLEFDLISIVLNGFEVPSMQGLKNGFLLGYGSHIVGEYVAGAFF